MQSLRFEPLPASAEEVETILKLWTQGRSQEMSPGAIRLSGAQASEAQFKQQASGKRVLHLATHGFFLAGKCLSALDETATPSAERGATTSGTGENPLLLAGLALAGANHRDAAQADEEDNILTAEEIGALNLEGVEWAVLSACDTGRGEVRAGEGLFGLRRAFQVAGAATVITSLWPVEDKAARTWMTTLYERHLLQRLDTAESVRQASLEVLRQRRARHLSAHPFYWAAFVATGDWR